MKKKLLLAIAISIFLCGSVSAQIEKRDWLLGGTAGVGNSTLYSSSNAYIAPHIGYAVGNNSVVGLKLQFNYSTQKYVSDIKMRDLMLNSTFFYKKYFVIKNKVGWYSELYAGGGITFDKVKYDSTGFFTKNQNWNLSAGFIPGIYYQATPFLLVTADFGGVNYTYTNNFGVDGSGISINFLSSFTFGVDFILRKHKN